MNRRPSAGAFLAAASLAGLLAAPAVAALDFGRYVALGDSMTAGFANGGLALDGQANSYPRLLVRQALGSGAPFEQPVMTAPGIPAVMRRNAPRPARLIPESGLGSPVNLTLPRPYDNLAVPGARAQDILNTATDRGGLTDLILRGIGTQLEQALLVEPTFASLWVGSSDFLSAAISGVVVDGVTLTAAAEFERDYREIVHSLVASGVTEGVVATIPSVATLPFVTAIEPWVTDPVTREPVLAEGKPVRLIGSAGPLSNRDFVLWTATPFLSRGDGIPEAQGGTGVPLPDTVVLDRFEARWIEKRIERYNEAIRRAAADVGFAVADMHRLFQDVASGALPDQGRGFFSLDGVHPSPLGSVFIANVFLESINETYGSRIPILDEVRDAPAGSDLEPWAEAGFFLTGSAYKSLRFGLGVPRTRKLLRLKERLRLRSRREGFRGKTYAPPPLPQVATQQRPSSSAVVRV